jgi:predicted RNase H-like HicB family nuclease
MLKDYHINIFYTEEDEGNRADIPEIKACSVCAKTPDQALAEVLSAKDGWRVAAKANGKPIPQPQYRLAICHIT